MQLIRCTAKLLKEIGLKPSNLHPDEPKFSFLGQWHANLIFIDRRKCVLFVNDRTLFNFIAPDVSRAQIRGLADLFLSTFERTLSAEGYPADTSRKILAEYEFIDIGKTSDRSVLGSATDLAFRYKHAIHRAGGLHRSTVPEIVQRMNRMPMPAGTRNSKFPIDEIGNLFGSTA